MAEACCGEDGGHASLLGKHLEEMADLISASSVKGDAHLFVIKMFSPKIFLDLWLLSRSSSGIGQESYF